MQRFVISRNGFHITCAQSLVLQGEWLADLLATVPDLHDGKTVQVGWTLLKFVRGKSGLVVHEPDFDGNALETFRPDVSASLKTLAEQVDFLKLVGAAGVPPRFDDKVIVKKGSLAEAKIYGERTALVPRDSGWYFGPMEEATSPEPESLEALWVYELLAARPELMKVLALPVGWLVVFEGPLIEAVINSKNQRVWPHDA